MLKGCYYRCPVVIEEGDSEYPRFFVLAQVVEYNELADAVKVKMHDLLGSKNYYSDIFKHEIYRADIVTRCEAMPGGVVEGPWGRGTVISRAKEPYDDNQPYWYWIKLPNGEFIKACESDIKIEYSQMNYAPEKQLRTYEFQHPTWFINHLKVSRNHHLVSNAPYGFRVLAGCRAFLMPHQISTVARCFETMPVRYMLADEVGLGKTVEACSILSILVSENKDLRALLIVPGALVGQWKNELHYKYGMEAQVASAKANLCILPMEDLENANLVLNAAWDLAIVDETHRLLNNDGWYHQIETTSKKVKHILLLSATPIQDRNEEYRRLLVLLNPEQYESMTSQQFAWMVKKQKSIQQKVNQQLGRLNRYDEYYEIIIDTLKAITETLEDKALYRLMDAVDVASADKGLDQVKQALAYICENYRVERKVIRNRRQSIMERMARRTLCAIPYTPLSLNENYNEIGVIQNTFKAKGDAVAEQIKIVWKDAATKYAEGTKGYLSMIGGLTDNPKQAKELADSISKTVNGALSVTSIKKLVADVDEAKRITHGFSLNPEIEAFLQKVSSQQATIVDLTPNVLTWLKEKKLTSKLKVRF